MGKVNSYASIEKRNFANALMRLLAEEYRFLGGPRVMQLLVEDVENLIQEFYPDTQNTASGTLIWTCTADEGKKAKAGQATEDYKTITIRLPLITSDELRSRTHQKVTPAVREKRQLARLLQSAVEQGGLLTIAELSVILGHAYSKIAKMAHEWQKEHNQPLPLKGYRMDQGARPTHKGDIVRLFEQGLEPPDVAYQSRHSLRSVERYLNDYERVKMLLKSGSDAAAISAIIGRGKNVVVEYIKIAKEYHPELFQNHF